MDIAQPENSIESNCKGHLLPVDWFLIHNWQRVHFSLVFGT